MALTVLMNAGPWLPVPPGGYGGIENVVATLVPELRSRGVRVVLGAAGGSTLEVDRLVETFGQGQFEHLAGPYNRNMGLAHAHMQRVVAELRADPEIDLVHDHLEVVGCAVGAALGPDAPPMLQTLHWDMRKHPDFYASFDGGGRVFFNAVGHEQLAQAPARIQEQALGVVPLSAAVERLPFVAEKGEHVLSLARITPEKGIDVAARVCRAQGRELVIAGPVGGIDAPEELARRLEDPESPWHGYADVRYYLEEVRPLEGDGVRWVGGVAGARKVELLASARAAIFPIRWSEPGGTAAVEALACGTPIVAMRRGALAFIVEHGVTGFLADTEAELGGYLARVGEIDPWECRRAAEERFSAGAMAEAYLGLYREVLARAGRGLAV